MAAGLLLGAPSRAAEPWVEVRTPHFVVASDAGEKEARRIGRRFEEIRAVFTQVWPWARVDPVRPVVIVAVRDEKGLRAFLPGYWERKEGVRPAGVFLDAAHRHYVALRTDTTDVPPGAREAVNPFHVLQHEYVHAVVGLNFERLPTWLNEGLAEFWGNTVIQRDAVEEGRPLPFHIFLLRERPLLPIDALLAVAPGSPHYDERDRANIFYAQSWALVHMLILSPDPGRAGQLNRYAQLLKAGREADPAAREAFGDTGALGKELERYVRRLTFRYRRRPLSVTADGSAWPTRRLAPAEVLALRGDFLLATGRDGEALALLEGALRLDSGQGQAQLAMALHHWREQEADEARAWAGRAAASGAGFFAHYLHGMLLAASSAEEDRRSAQSALAEAARLNPDYAPAHAAGATLAASLGAPPETTLPLARRAVALEPADASHRIALASLLAQAGRLDEAKAEARRARAIARDSGERDAAQRLLEVFALPAAGPAPAGAETLCERGDARACLGLAERYRTGTASHRDPARALRYYHRACDAGDADGCAGLGWALERGDGAPVDPPGAAAAYGRACEAASTWACVRLGALLVDGEGVARDDTRAAAYFTRGCREELPEACSRLASLHESGRGVAKDLGRATQLYEEACSGDDPWSCWRLGLLLERGLGRAPDLARAGDLYASACDGGHAPACTDAGLLQIRRSSGSGHARAAARLEQACAAGDARGCAHLGTLYEAGVGVAKDLARARSLYRKACDAGHVQACARAGAR